MNLSWKFITLLTNYKLRKVTEAITFDKKPTLFSYYFCKTASVIVSEPRKDSWCVKKILSE